MYKKLSFNVLKINPPGFIIVGGMVSENDQRYPVTVSTDVIHAHSYDYDLFLKTKDKHIINQFSSYAVFLDEYIPFEPDALHSNREYHCSKEDYYPSVKLTMI